MVVGCVVVNYVLYSSKILDWIGCNCIFGKVRAVKTVMSRLCKLLLRGIQQHLESEKPVQWLFTGKDASGKSVALSPMGVQWVVKQARQQSGIRKAVTTHILRHTYATHLLEMGLDIMTLKGLLGHADIQTTLIYLHVAQCSKTKGFSPLEKLYS